MKIQKKSVLLVLASSFLLLGCANGNRNALVERRYVLADGADGFTVTTNLEEVKEIHTARQKEYLSYQGEYVSIPEANYPDGSKHLSDPEPVNLAWEFNAASGKTVSTYDVKVGQKADLSDGYVIKGTSNQSLDVYNSFLGDNYFQIIANYADGSKDESAIQKYKVDDVYPRNLKIDGMTNCRDMGGGRELVDGGHIKQGLIYRTSSTSSWAYGRGDVPDTITTAGKEVLFNQLGCVTEVNVNNSGSSVQGIKNYVEAYMWYDSGKHHLYRNAEPIKTVFHALADPDNYPLFYHCRIGTDRTGLCAILISGLLGVPENLIYQDYLFSNFGNIQEKRYIGEKAGRDNILNYINDLKAFPGEKFHNKVYNYLLSIGIPANELNNIIDILVEGNKPSGNDNYQELILAEDFDSDGTEMKTSANRAHPSKYFTLGAGQSVTATFDAKYDGLAKLVAYLGNTDGSASKTISDSITAIYDGNTIEVEETTFADAGFGQGDGRTYYSAVVLGEVDVVSGPTMVTIEGIANNLNIGAISVISPEAVKKETPVTPEPGDSSNPDQPVEPDQPAPEKKGCGGSIVATSSLIALVGIAGVAFFASKRKEN